MRLTALTLTAALLLMAAPALASNVGVSFTVGIQSTRTTFITPLDPAERDVLSAYSLVYESLIVINDDYEPEGCLAESWKASSDGKTWTFTLRPDIVFSDGTPLTASDVVASAQWILDRANDTAAETIGYYGNLKYFISSIRAADEHTVTVKTSRANYSLPYAMTFPVVPADRVSETNPPGTGPYYISAFSPNAYLYLDVNQLWWRNLPAVQAINFTLYDTDRAVVEAYQFGEVDAIFTRSTAAAQYKGSTKSIAISYRTSQLDVLLMNEGYTKLASVNVRKAIRLALDLDKITNGIYSGMGERTNFPVLPGTWLYNSSLDSNFTYNLAEAARLLEEDGWNDSNGNGILDKLGDDDTLIELTLPLYVYEEPDNSVRIPTANHIKDQLALIGIDVEIHTVSYADCYKRLSAGNFHLCLCSFSMDTAPDPGFLLMSSNTGNFGRYRSGEMDELFKEKLRKTQDRESFRNHLYAIEQLIVDDCPIICIQYRTGVILTRYMFTSVRDVREGELLRGIESFNP